jgi:hypothetical protein
MGAVLAALGGCGPRHARALTVDDLMEDRVTLDGLLMKCGENPEKARTDADCLKARIAIDRLDDRSTRLEAAKRAQEFERSREQLRLTQEKQRQEQEARDNVDAYHLPLVPVEPAPAQPAGDNNVSGNGESAGPPVARESNP